MEYFDDFDIMRQADEWPTQSEGIIPEKYEDWLQSIETTQDEVEPDGRVSFHWKTHEVDCDDGTHGDIIYEYIDN